jgi:hypothetical protein
MKTRTESLQGLIGLSLIAVSIALVYWPAAPGVVGFLLFVEAAWGRT